MKTFTQIAAALTLGLAAAAPAGASDEGLALRIAMSAGTAIAAQGNAALAEIRRELKDSLADHLIKPFLPAPEAPAQTQPKR